MAETERAAIGGRLKRRGAVGVLGDDVDALVEQRRRGVRLAGWIVPGIHPHDAELDVGIDRLRAQHERVDAGDDFRDREGADIADDARLRHLRRDLADDVAALVELRRVGRDVVGTLVARRVLETHVGIARGDLERRLHEAE